ncbi:hypothetical protein MPSEU_000393300 [Mayamaea pseudoterrestris]|nr:hypothetical protein MPSEU_000393300 [Mayamaea pseudoterrestris]
MAAKQGLTAHLSQASEDAKRAVLSRTTLTTSTWFSNLNTVCTIKSAPPKTPDVLQMLASKSGWLYKRNEQHVWQARWCCVVPHTFLYYFDATPLTANGNTANHGNATSNNNQIGDDAAAVAATVHPPTPAQQEEWNRAVQNGYGKHRKQPEKRSNFYLFSGTGAGSDKDCKEMSACANESTNDATTATHPELSNDHDDDHPPTSLYPTSMLAGPDASKFSSLQPAGIIDLECYSRVQRSSTNPLVLELGGDDQVNPDLRQFYFTAAHVDDADDWSDALLNQRHSALVDECDAYKQVCDGFAQQLQQLHIDLDHSTRATEESQEELYRVRSQLELDRRNCWNMVEEVLEATATATVNGSCDDFRTNLDRARRQDLGVATAVQLLRDYTQSVIKRNMELEERNAQLEAQLQQTGQSDQQKVSVVQEQMLAAQAQHDIDKQSWESQLDIMTAKHGQLQKELQDVQKELSSTRMEMTMYQTQQKNKTTELLEHKRILKKEVIDLRTKLDDALAEVTSLKHEQTSASNVAQQEREKNKLLERYVEKIESQVKVQHSMMEIMSHSAACSVYGGDRSVDLNAGGGSVRGSLPPLDFKRNIGSVHGGKEQRVIDSAKSNPVMNDEDEGDDEDEEDDDGDGDVNEMMMPVISPRGRRLFAAVEDDAKSHMSELTEDRTQRHFDSFRESFSPYQDASPRPYLKQQPVSASPHVRPPPYVIGGSPPTGRESRRPNNDPARNNRLSTNSLPPSSASSRRLRIPKAGNHDNDATSVTSEQRLSVAQKARLEADERSTTVPVRVDEAAEASLKKKKKLFGFVGGGSKSSDQSQKDNASVESGLWRHVEEAILGPRPEDMLSDSGSVSEEQSIDSPRSPREPQSDSKQSKAMSCRTNDTDSQSSARLSIQERAQLQRARQKEFLRNQGLEPNQPRAERAS